MTTSLVPGNSATPRRKSAWSAVLINQLAFPGLGTIISGRRIGYVQAAIMLTGFLLTMGFFIYYFVCVVRFFSNAGGTREEFVAMFRPYLWSLYWGIGLSALAWFWSLKSSLEILKQEKQDRFEQTAAGLNPPKISAN